MKKRLLALLLVLAMVFSLMPAALAAVIVYGTRMTRRQAGREREQGSGE